MAFLRVAAMDDLWSGDMRGVVVQGTNVLLVRMDDTIYAYEDRCVHLGVKLSKGSLEGSVLTCSAHGWQYDVCTGAGVNPASTRLTPIPVKVEGEAVFVDVAPISDRVGPVLEANDAGRAIALAIREQNRGVEITDRGSYLRVLAPRRCVLTRRAVEPILGRAFKLPADLELVMPSFLGSLSVTEEEATWAFVRPP